MDPEEEEEKGKITKIYPHIIEIFNEKVEYGVCEYCINRSSLETSRGHVQRDTTRFYVVLTTKIDQSGINEMEEIFKLLVMLKDTMVENNRGEV